MAAISLSIRSGKVITIGTLALMMGFGSSKASDIKRPHALDIKTSMDSTQIVDLETRMYQSRAQMDVLIKDLIYIKEKLQDPHVRIALVRQMRSAAPKHVDVQADSSEVPPGSPLIINAISIDLRALGLIRDEGLSLDQARLRIIESLSDQEIADYYSTLERDVRFEHYELMELILQSGDFPYELARKSAIYFYLYAK